MREQIDRLTKLATDLLDLSRLDAGRLRVEQEPLDLAELARDARGGVPGVARASGHELAVDGRRRARPRSATRSGCCRSAGSSSRTPSCTRPRARRSAPHGAAERLGAADGRGRGPGYSGRARAPTSSSASTALDGTVASGSGLGLAIARELAELMGGTVELAVVPGRTIFALVLPSSASRRAANGQPAFSRGNGK